MKLNEGQRQSLITSLLAFVRRVSFHGADNLEESQALQKIAGMLFGLASEICEERGEIDSEQESENEETSCECECCCHRYFECTE